MIHIHCSSIFVVCKMLRFYSPSLFSPPGVFSPLMHKSHVTDWPLSIFLCEVTPVCYWEGVARKTAYSRPQSVCYLLRECGGGRGGVKSKKGWGEQGVPWCRPGPRRHLTSTHSLPLPVETCGPHTRNCVIL